MLESRPAPAVMAPDSAPSRPAGATLRRCARALTTWWNGLVRSRSRLAHALVLLQLLAIATLALVGAFLLRFEFKLEPAVVKRVLVTVPVALVLHGTAFYAVGLHRRWLRHCSFADGLSIIAAVTTSSLVLGALTWWRPSPIALPHSVIVLEWVLLQGFLGVYYGSMRVYQEARSRSKPRAARALVVGDKAFIVPVLRGLKTSPRWVPVGVLSRDPAELGLHVLGVPVKGSFGDLAAAMETTQAETVCLVLHGLGRDRLLALLAECRQHDFEYVCFSSPLPVHDGPAHCEPMDDIELILRRREISIDAGALQQLICGRRLLVTGAGGSIGSELSRQVAQFGPSELCLLDRSENNLFFIHREIRQRWPELDVQPFLVDIADEPALDRVFAVTRPHVVFHAAAHKHVGMMERHPHEAIKNNVIGTYNAAATAAKFGAEVFVNISTDKAVNPTSFMGLSKRLAEICVQEVSATSRTRFVIVRFGNVAGSTGSVVQLFRQQIRAGGPVTVTDRNATRFFMSIAEAVRLVLQAAVLGESGRIFVLDTGHSVNIHELARSMISLAGFVPDVDIPISFTGLVGGEKLHEELLDPSEQVEKRLAHDRLVMIRAGQYARGAVIGRLAHWKQLATGERLRELMTELESVWPNFPYERYPNGAHAGHASNGRGTAHETAEVIPATNGAHAAVGGNGSQVRHGIGAHAMNGIPYESEDPQ